MSTQQILQYLKNHGERFDTQIAEAAGMPVKQVRRLLYELAEKQEVMTCQTIRYENGQKIEAVSCRLVGYIPKTAPGKKSKVVSIA